MRGGEPISAVVSFSKALVIQIKVQNINGICEARIQLALAFLKTGQSAKALDQLETLLEFTESNDLPDYTAQSYRYLGEYHLNQGTPHLATPLLLKALHIFDELGVFNNVNREQAANLAAISAGQELMPHYVDLILKCGRPGLKKIPCLLKLVDWKDTRELFWVDGDESSIGTRSVASFEQSLLDLICDIPMSMEGEGEGEGEEYYDDAMEF